MYYLLTVSPAVMFVVFCICGACFFSVGLLFLRIFSRQASRDMMTIPIGAFVGTISTVWALSLGFVAADIWAVNGRAEHAASEERSSIARLVGMAQPSALDDPKLLQALRDYRLVVMQKEWEEDYNTLPSRQVENALQNIRVSLISLAGKNIPGSIMSKIVQDFDELQDARNTRLAIGSSSINHYKWYLVFFLTVLAVVVITAVHADRPKAGRKALVIYTVTAMMSMWILAVHASPYSGISRIEPTILFTSQRNVSVQFDALKANDNSSE